MNQPFYMELGLRPSQLLPTYPHLSQPSPTPPRQIIVTQTSDDQAPSQLEGTCTHYFIFLCSFFFSKCPKSPIHLARVPVGITELKQTLLCCSSLVCISIELLIPLIFRFCALNRSGIWSHVSKKIKIILGTDWMVSLSSKCMRGNKELLLWLHLMSRCAHMCVQLLRLHRTRCAILKQQRVNFTTEQVGFQ